MPFQYFECVIVQFNTRTSLKNNHNVRRTYFPRVLSLSVWPVSSVG